MKKIVLFFIIISLLFVSLNAFAVSFRPNTVKEMDVDISLVARGGFIGIFSEGDSAELRMLAFNDSLSQEILSVDEKLFIGEKIISPRYEFEGENKLAVFEIDRLKEFESDPSFIIEVQARIKTNANIELDKRTVEIFNEQIFLEESQYIEVNDSELQSKAELEFQSESDLELIREIALWVNSNIEYDFENYYNGVWSAKDTYNSRKGVCDEFANLTAAFSRIKKIPTRYITGISFDGQRFGNHGWLEVFLKDTGWVGLDSTYLEAGYLDGAHIKLATGVDPSNAVNLKIITKSIYPIEVTTSLDLPDVKINEVKFFDGVTDITLLKPEELGQKEEFEIIAIVKNKLNSNIIIPIEIALHENFEVENPSRLEWFKPLEEKTISFKVVSPEIETDGYYYNYQLFFLAPDQNISSNLSVFPRKNAVDEKSDIKIIDISPFIEEKNLKIEVLFKNFGSIDGNAKITASYAGQKTEKQAEIKPDESKKVVLVLTNISFGNVFLKIDSDESREVKITIPKEQNNIQIENVDNEKDQGIFGFNFATMLSALVVLIIIVLGVFIIVIKKLK